MASIVFERRKNIWKFLVDVEFWMNVFVCMREVCRVNNGWHSSSSSFLSPHLFLVFSCVSVAIYNLYSSLACRRVNPISCWKPSAMQWLRAVKFYVIHISHIIQSRIHALLWMDNYLNPEVTHRHTLFFSFFFSLSLLLSLSLTHSICLSHHTEHWSGKFSSMLHFFPLCKEKIFIKKNFFASLTGILYAFISIC